MPPGHNHFPSPIPASFVPCSRRTFLRTATSSAALVAFCPTEAFGRRHATPSGPTIDRVTAVEVPGSFYRPIAMNAYDDAPKGQAGTIRLVTLTLSDGTTGIGVEGYAQVDDKTVAGIEDTLLGANPLDVYQWQGDRIRDLHPEYRSFFQDARYAWLETPLLDAIGKRKGTPVHALFGTRVRDHVAAYDGTLYFKDVEQERDAEVIGELAARIKADGYKAIKMKVGRSYKWMEGEAGVTRDIEAVAAAREAVGPNFNLMADANNGYQDHFDWALRFLEATAPHELYWMEEIFPDNTEQYHRLLDELHARNVSVPIAEGETIWQIDEFRPYLDAGVFDVIQPDMRTVGFSNVLRAADLAASHGAMLVPHNWQSEVGKLMSIHAALVTENIRFAEDDRWSNHALDTSDYVFRDGQWTAPKQPGWGIALNDHYDRIEQEAEPLAIS